MSPPIRREDMKSSKILRAALLLGFIVGISLLHYFTPLRLPALHDVFQRLYYLPIVLAALWFGLRGGLFSALMVSIVYVPHIVFQWGGELTVELEKYLEIILYNVVGGITGLLSQREQEQRVELQQTAQGLVESNRKLQKQSELIIEIEGQLRNAERLSTIGELSAVLAHEIRNPLGSIRGTAEILRDDFRPGDRKYEFFEILLKESDRLNRVVEDFLRIARPQPAIIADCDVLEELGNIVTLVTAEAKKRGIHLELRPATLPTVRGDREKLRQAFLNLVLNGLQATPRGRSLTISAAPIQGKEGGPAGVEIAFADTGLGISPEALGKIFDPFFTTKEGGTGLGLATTRKIVESHGGRIEVETELGQGTLFRVLLPVQNEGGEG